jgi:H+-transporting ATPase
LQLVNNVIFSTIHPHTCYYNPSLAIPADCRVNSSEIDVDQAALTGESLPVTFYKGDSCKMGSTVVRGEVEATVEFTGINTFFGKTASLLADTGEHSHLQKGECPKLRMLMQEDFYHCQV